MTARLPSRSGDPFVAFCTVSSDASAPAATRNSVIRPANGSAIVFHTNAAAGPLSSASYDTDSPLSRATAGNGRSAADGR